MIPLELFIILTLIAGALFVAHILYIGADQMFDILAGILSTVMMIILSVMFAAGNVGYAIGSGHLVAIQSIPVVFILLILSITILLSTLYRVAITFTQTYRRGY